MAVFRRNGTWWIDWYEPDGRRRRQKISPEKRTAVAVLRDIQAKIAKGEYLGIKEETITFQAFFSLYWEAVAPTLSVHEQHRAKGIFDQHLLPRWGVERLSRMTRQMIEAYRAERAGQVRSSTVNKEFSRLRHCFNRAVAWGYLKENPCRGIKPFKEPPGRLRYLFPGERPRLLAACREYRKGDLEAVVLCAMYTGMRQGEILGLRWADVDLQAKTLTIRKSKNNELRIVPMNASLLAVLMRLPRPDDSQAPVFPGWTRAQLTMTFRRAVRRAGISDFRFHDLRHDAASWMTMRGAPIRAVQTLLGHKDLRMTMRYTHLSQDSLRDAVALLDEGVPVQLDSHSVVTEATTSASRVA